MNIEEVFGIDVCWPTFVRISLPKKYQTERQNIYKALEQQGPLLTPL